MLEHLTATLVIPPRVVVIGAGGFVGAAIVRTLIGYGAPVLPLTRAEVDLLTPDAAEKLASLLLPSDCVMAVSAIAPVKTLAMLRDNLTMVEAMAEAFADVPPAHLLNIGSDAVFADAPLPLTEASPKAPFSLHGVMHLAREVVFSEVKTRLATLRPTLIYGAADPHNGYGPNRFRRLAAAGQPITLFGEGEERRDHVLVDDVADLAARIVLHQSSGSLNAATGTVWSFRDIAERVAALQDHPVVISGSPRQGPMPHGGYRPFDPAATFTAFPDFRYTPLPEGLALVQAACDEGEA
jgi:nucleoside-diphosphate-sugar epimerase